jgi:hypothetical protein
MEKCGRAAPGDHRYYMTFNSPSPETLVLNWDGANTTLSFFYLLKYQNCPIAPVVQLAWSADRTCWAVLWNSSGSWFDASQWVGVRLQLPVSAAAPYPFALKWIKDDTETGLDTKRRCGGAYVDDIDFPATLPTSDTMGLGNAAGPLESDSLECGTCKDVCVPALQRDAEDRAAASNVLGRPGLGH